MSAQVYLVGGAVRDELLGLKIKERDWMVTGSTPEELIEQGYRQVGTTFPVFLHPKTGEEHALARTERKEGHGYHGFAVDFHPGVTVEEDLERRDLTINAIAKSDNGELIDPFGGFEDIQKRLLRHVSAAFSEDPLRVLRVAKFAARFAHLGFTVHPETLELMRVIAHSGELEHLVAERIWSELLDGLSGQTPSAFLQVLRDCGALEVLFPENDALFGVPQPERYHPEIDTGLHVQMAMDFAASQNWSSEVRFAVMMHDLGKGLTEKSKLPSHLNHGPRGVPLVKAVCKRLRVPNAHESLAVAVCDLHIRCHQMIEMRASRIMSLMEEADLIRRPERLEPFIQACEADYRGRKGLSDRSYPQGDQLREAHQAVISIRASDLNLEGLEGKEVGVKLRQSRIEAIDHRLKLVRKPITGGDANP